MNNAFFTKRAMNTTILFQGKTIEFDEHGYLININIWTEDLAIYLSELDGLELKADHLEVIHFMREYYTKYQITPMARIIAKKINKHIGQDKYSVKYLYKLFPKTPVRHACRYAGIPRPSGCT